MRTDEIIRELEDVKKIMQSDTKLDCFPEGCRSVDCTVCLVEKAIDIVKKHSNDEWIPVSERLPDVNKPVFVTFREWNDYDKMHRYGTCKAIWIPGHTLTDDDLGWHDSEDVTEYDESEDKYYIKEGWWEVIENWPDYTEVYISGEVIAWQPLPEPYRDSEVEK